MTSTDEKLSQFIELTGTTVHVARDILEACQWDIERATNFFYGVDPPNELPNQTPAAPPPPPPKSPNSNLNTQKAKTPSNSPSSKLPPNKLNLSPHVVHTESQEKPEKLILSGTHEKFNEYRLDAQDKNRWLLVLLTEKPLVTTVLKQVDLRDFTNTRYVPLEINREETDGQWFSNTYNAKELPFYAIIDPMTTELLDKHEGKMTSYQRQLFLKEFLNKHPEKGRSIDDEMTSLYNYTLESSSSEKSSSSDESEKNNEPEKNEKEEKEEPENKEAEDPGPIVKIMIQYSNKRTKIEIGENEKIKVLYKKVGSLLKKNIESFKLVIPYPNTDLTDLSKTILEMKLKNSMVRVEDVM